MFAPVFGIHAYRDASAEPAAPSVPLGVSLVSTSLDGRPSGACDVCGFVPGATPSERIVASVMQVPSQYRALLAGFGSLGEIDAALRTRPDDTEWTALERIVQVADWLHVSARAANAMLDGDGRALLVYVDAPRAGANDLPVQVVLGSLHAAATDLAHAVSGADVAAWERPHVVGRRTLSVRDVLERALHLARHRLLDVDEMLAASANVPGGLSSQPDW